MIRKELVAASAEPLVLSLLAKGESYGYAIIQEVKARSEGKLNWTDGMLYPVLHRMEHRGLIKSRWGESETGRKRKYYSLKKDGKTAMAKHHEHWTLIHGVLAGLKRSNMFDLEQAITEWRQQMLAAGIQTPMPLEELESHLREEIERQVKLGLSEAEALQVGVENFGETHRMQSEFKKLEGHNIWRPLLLISGWLAASFTLLAGVSAFDLDWNFFSFHPKWNAAVFTTVCLMLVAALGIWRLAKASRDQASRMVSALVCLILAGIGTYNFFRVETGILGGVREVPAWYRGGLLLILCLPGIFWIWCERRRVILARNSTHGSQYV